MFCCAMNAASRIVPVASSATVHTLVQGCRIAQVSPAATDDKPAVTSSAPGTSTPAVREGMFLGTGPP